MPHPTPASPAASLIVTSADRWEELLGCLTALLQTTGGVPHELIVVDDGSRDATRIALPRLDGIRYIRNDAPAGRAVARNHGAAVALAEVLVFLDDRARPEAGWLAALLAALGPGSPVKVAAPRLLLPDGAPRAMVAIDGPAGDAPGGARAVIAVAPEVVAVRAECFRSTGGFEAGFQAGGEVAELCLHARQGGGVVVEVPESAVACTAPQPTADEVRHDEERLAARWPALFGAPGPTEQAPVAAPAGRRGGPKVSIVIPAFDKWPLTFRCLCSLVEHTRDMPHEVIVVDNGSSDETRTALPQLSGIRLVRNEENLGFARASNQGAALARAPYILFLNNDTEALPGWLPPMLEMMESDPKMAIVGSRLLFPDGTLQHGGVAVHYASPLPIHPTHIGYREPREASDKPLLLSAVTAACMLVRREVFEAAGGFDESFRNGYEDVDLCFRVRERGGLVGYAPQSVLYHHESQSAGRFAAAPYNENLLQRRWIGRFQRFDVDRRKAPSPPPPRAGRPPLSVVLPVKDGLRGIAPCLEDLAANLGPGDQIVVVDAGSRDCTLQFVDAFALEHPGLVRIAEVDASRDLPGAARLGVASTANTTVVLLPRLVRMPAGFLDGFVDEIERGPLRLAALPLGERGFVIGGARERVAALLERAPGAPFSGDAQAVAAAATATTTPAHREATSGTRPSTDRDRAAASLVR